MPARIVCLGDVMIDVVATLSGPLALGSDVHAPIRYIPGGSAANTAAWLASIGEAVALIGRVGADALGEQAHGDLAAAAIIDRLQTDVRAATGTCIVLVTPGGERTMVPDPGANANLDPSAFDPNDFRPDDHLHVSGYALLGGARAGALAALALARSAAMTISVDAASAAPLAAAGASAFLGSIGADLTLFANADEAAVLTGADDPSDGARRLAAITGQSVVKAGANGAYWCAGGEVVFAPAQPITVVDTTGAGDAFAAAFLAAWRHGDDPASALTAGHRLAAIACQHLGGRPPKA